MSLIASAILCQGCTIAPHGSHTTHTIRYYAGRSDGLIRCERWTDRSAGGGMLFFSDPTLNNAAYSHTNSILQVGGSLTIGNATVTVDPNTGSVISAAGTAVGNVIGAAMKTAVKP